jgi:probable HAF family extracellular repeat protein
MRHRRLGARATVATLALALLGLGSAPALAHTAKPSSRHYTAVDLGTLGGTYSSGFALDRDTVVGSSTRAGDDFNSHAFAYDRSTHVMTDLGTLGGPESLALGVEGRYVIGDSSLAGGDRRGFVHDLRTHRTQTIGTFGGTDSHVTAISGGLVVGSARTPGNQNTHAYAYDPRTRVLTELDSPVGPDGTSTAAGTSEGRYVAGTWDYPDTPFEGGHAYVHDLRTRAWTDLSAYDNGVSSKVTSITGHTVVGTFQPKPDGSSGTPPERGFAYDIRSGLWSDLGPEMSYRPIVTGHTVLATTRPGAYAYDLRSRTLSAFGPGPGRTYINGVAGKYAAGDTNPGSFAYVYRVDTGEFTLLPAIGGVHSTASDVDRQGAAVGNSATASGDPASPDGVYHATLWTVRHG